MGHASQLHGTVWALRSLALGAVVVGLSGLLACQGSHDATPDYSVRHGASHKGAKAPAKKFTTTYRPRPSGSGSGIVTDLRDRKGQLVKAPCGSCHAGKAPALRRKSGESLKIFHSGLKLQHGGLSCLTCHNNDNYDTLRLADDTEVPFDDLMTLCGQCHGPQKRDYDHGSHGGMTGHWDLNKGPRVRNQCVHCHDPHAPAYVGVMPAPGPRDRFLQHLDPKHLSKGH